MCCIRDAGYTHTAWGVELTHHGKFALDRARPVVQKASERCLGVLATEKAFVKALAGVEATRKGDTKR
jgi:hypothetical protein